MPEAVEPPPSPTGGTPAATGPAEELRQDLATGDPGRLARGVGAFRRGVVFLALPIVATGVLAVALALWAWRDTPLAIVVAVLLALPAVVLPVNAVRRTRAAAQVAAHPQQALDQARDLLGRARHLPGLDELAAAARPFRGPDARRPSPRQAIRLLRLLSSTVEAAKPDPAVHPLLLPLRPEQLGKLWRGAAWSLTAWPVAGLVAVVSLVAGLVGV